MADNTTLEGTLDSSGDTIRTEDRTTFKTPVSLIDVGGVSAEALIGDAGNFMPVEGAAAHDAAAAGNPILVGAQFDDTTPDSVDEGDVGQLRISANRNLYVTLRDAAGNERGLNVDASGDVGVTSADLSTLAGAVSGSEMQVDLVSANVTNAGTFAVQEDGAALTALQLIDDAVYVDDADWSDGSSKHLLVGGLYQSTPQTITDGDVGPFQVTSNGYLIVSVNGTVTVSGTVTANLSATDNAVLDQIELNTDFGTVTGGGVEASALRVTIANDSTGVLSIDDNGGAITVDNAGTFVSQIDGDALTALQKIDDPVLVDDAAFTPATSSVMMAGFEYDDTTPDSVDEGDAGAARMSANRNIYTQLRDAAGNERGANVNASNSLEVHITGNDVATGGTSSTDDGAFTAGSGSGTPAMGFFSTDTVDANDVGVLAMDASRRMMVSIEVDNVGIGGGTQYTEDDAAPANPVGNAFLAERDDALGGLTPAEGDWTHLYTDANGALWTAINNTVMVDGSGVTQPVSGTVTANLSATDNAVLDAIQAAVEIMDDWDETDRAKVNPIVGQAGVQGGSGVVSALTQRVVLATDVALPAGSNSIGTLGANSGVDIGDVDVTSIAAGANLIGDVGIQPRASGGCLIFRSLDLDESEEEVKATAGQVYGMVCLNLASSVRYLKFYNLTAASTTVGTSTPVLTIPIPTQGDTNGAGFVLNLPQGIEFTTAITVAATTGVADADTGAPGANEVVLNLFYE